MNRTRREALKLAAAAGAAAAFGLRWRGLPAEEQGPGSLIQRRIPHTGDQIPIIGIGTARRYDVGTSEAELAPLRQVLRNFTRMGGSVIDTAPTYGRAEEVVGQLIQQIGNRDKIFIATKISLRGRSGRQAGIEQMQQSMRRFGTDHIELMQVHNLNDWQTQLPLIREWKAAGKLGNVGITTSFDAQYEEMERIMRSQKMDMIQVDYAINNRNSERRILPLAADRGLGVLINLPFGRKSTFAAVHGKPLPKWAADYDIHSWAQYFLKWIVSHPAVTAAIPGTSTMSYLVDNIAAARGRLPDAKGRQRMLKYFESL